MPEDVKLKEGDKGPQPAVDADAIKAIVSDALSNWTPPEPQRREPERRPEPQPADPLADLIGSRVNPALKMLGYEIADAKDAALFYVDHPQMVKHKTAIEEAFNALKSQGTPMARAAVSDWYRGKNWDKFREEEKKTEKVAGELAGIVRSCPRTPTPSPTRIWPSPWRAWRSSRWPDRHVRTTPSVEPDGSRGCLLFETPLDRSFKRGAYSIQRVNPA